MRIALDARTIYRPDRRGTGKNLVDLYAHVLTLKPDWQVLALHRSSAEVAGVLPPAALPRRIEMPGDRLNAWERFRLPWAAWSQRADVLHCPANTAPAWMPVPALVTIHDLIPLDMPQWYAPAYVERFAGAVRHACQRAAGIICPSHYTAQRLRAEFQADPEHLAVIPWAPDSAMRALDRAQCQSVLAAYGVAEPYVLHFGGADPRKNTRRLIEAWAMLDAATRRIWKLLIVGLDPSAQETLRPVVQRLELTDSIVMHDFAAEADLPALLSAAEVLAYPSLSEGFGLPILDAFVAGTPVLTSNVTSLPEVAGKAAVLTDPCDACAMARGLAWLIRDRRLRDEMVALGRRRVQEFTWARTARCFVSAVEQAAAGNQKARQAA